MKSAKEKNAIHLYPLTLPRMKVPPLHLRLRAEKKNAWKLFCGDPTGQRTMNDVFASCSPERLNLLGRQMGHSVGDSNIPNIVTRADLTFVPLNLLKHSGELVVQCLNQTLFSPNFDCLRSNLSNSLLLDGEWKHLCAWWVLVIFTWSILLSTGVILSLSTFARHIIL